MARPWWERWPDWWGHQKRAVEGRWGRGQGFTSDPPTHTVTWKGSAKVKFKMADQGSVREKVEAVIVWGAGTPFLPPRVYFPSCTSAVHQLKDGSLCLMAPNDPENGWEGLIDIGFWLSKAEEWLIRYRKEGWRLAPELWAFHRMSLPGYRYRLDLPPTQVVALPPSWNDMPPGCGRVRVALPRSGRSIGAVVAWEDGNEKWRSWGAASVLVRGDVDELSGLWMRFKGRPLAGPAFSAPEQIMKLLRLKSIDRFESMAQRSERIALTGFQAEPEAPASWVFERRMASEAVAGSDPVSHLIQLLGVPKDVGIGLPIHRDDLDRRRLADRSAPMQQAISSAQIVLIGLGSLGSEIAHLLAQEGVMHYLLIDRDLMLPGNVARHRVSLSQSGQLKVDAVAQLIKQVQPEATVEPAAKWFDELFPTLAEDSKEALTIFVGATGDEATEHLIGDIAREMATPCIHAWLEFNGTVLRATRYLPGRDPTLSAAASDPETPRLEAPSNPAGPRLCADAVLPGSALNIHAAANFVVRLVLEVIGGSPAADNHWLFAPGGVVDERMPAALRRPYGVLAAALTAR